MNNFDRRQVLGILIAAVLASAGCNDQSAPMQREDVQTPRSGGRFEIAQIAPSSLDPATVFDSYDASLVNQIYDGLLQHDRNFTVRPNIAHSWTISRDGRTYRFDLKHGVLFHDQTEVTADDVVFSFTRIFDLDPDATELARLYLDMIAGARAYMAGEADSIRGLRSIDRYTIEIELERPYAAFLNVLASEFARIVPQDFVENMGEHILERAPIGCGPFRLERWDEGERLVLHRFEGYHGTPARLERLVVNTPPDPVLPRSIDAFLNGQLHAVELTNAAPEVVAAVKDAVVHSRREQSITFLGFNTERPPFNDVRLRRAIAHSINLHALTGIETTVRSPATGILPPGFPGFTPGDKLLEFSPPLADSLVRSIDGFDFDQTIILAMPRRSQAMETLISDLCRQICATGIKVEPLFLEWDAFHQGLHDGSFAAFLLTWLADIPDPDSFFYPLFHSEGSVNLLHYADDFVDEQLDGARRDTDRGQRMAQYAAAERKLLDDAALVPIHFSSTLFAVRGNVREFEITSMGGANLPYQRVWLDDTDTSAEGLAR